MIRVYKYPLKFVDDQTVELQGDPISVLVQNDTIMLYAYHDESEAPRTYDIHVAGTGHPIDDYIIKTYIFLGSTATYSGRMITHVFYKLRKELKFEEGETVRIVNAKEASADRTEGVIESIIKDIDGNTAKAKITQTIWVDVDYLQKVKQAEEN